MASWVALRRRIAFQAGQTVLVLGATGASGQMAVQVAKRLGAAHVIAAGRNPQRLAELVDLGADTTVRLGDSSDELGKAAADVDVVVDYLWGPPTADALTAITTNRSDDGQPLAWIQIGSVAGPTAAIPSAALRVLPLQIVGSGQGSVSTSDILAVLPDLIDEISNGNLRIGARPVPLADVTSAWADTDDTQRIVITP